MTIRSPEERRLARRAEAGALFHAARPLLTDLAATLAFYILLVATGRLAVAVAGGVALGVAQLGWMAWRRRPIAPMQWAMLLLVGLVGGAALVLHDPRLPFFKAGVGYLLVGAAMLRPGWMERYVPPIARGHLPERALVAAGFAWAALILGTGLLVLALALSVPARTAAAVMGVWAPASKIALFAGQYLFFRRIVRRRLAAAAT